MRSYRPRTRLDRMTLTGLACLALASAACATQTPDSADDVSVGGGKSDDGNPALLGGYVGPGGATLWVDEGEAVVTLLDGNWVGGVLERDGTLGGAFTIRVAEGTVCGSYRISLFESEGVVGDGSEVSLTWLRPAGSVASTCGYMLAGEGTYVRTPSVESPPLIGSYEGPGGAALWVDEGQAIVTLPDGNWVGGVLERDGTLGGAFTIEVTEGMVCGSYRISLWESEGVIGDGSEVSLTWLRPAGSVASACAYMLAGVGTYRRE